MRELILLRRHWRLPFSLGLLLAVLLELAAGRQRPGRLRLGLLGLGIDIYAAWLARTTARLYSLAEDERARLEAVIAYSPAGILLFGQESGQITANATAAVLLGLPAGAGLDRQQLDALMRTPEGARLDAEELPWVRALAGVTLYNHEALIVRPDGTSSPVLINAAPSAAMVGSPGPSWCFRTSLLSRSLSASAKSSSVWWPMTYAHRWR